jgi:hypothetical protein
VKLTELAPRWVGVFGAPSDAKQGVSFQCPCCAGATRLAIFFDVPICSCPAADINLVHRQQSDELHLNDEHVGRTLWHREGDSFETLTLTPSIDASHFGHWHGFITAGEIR